jgi:prepilin signal peptidase PulO-like enzyme (type II secretory pathway)
MLAVVVAALAVLPVSLALLARHGGAALRMGVPFGPFLALGAVVALLAG